jgi:hypothetical protein
MSCCSATITQFFNTPSTTINYGPTLQALHGAAPKISVLYWDGTQYVAAGVMTNISFDTYPVAQIVVDHGGPASGIIKLG